MLKYTIIATVVLFATAANAVPCYVDGPVTQFTCAIVNQAANVGEWVWHPWTPQWSAKKKHGHH
jgi:hypothetical protein